MIFDFQKRNRIAPGSASSSSGISGRGNQCLPQPFGFAEIGIPYRSQHVTRFLRSQTDGEYGPKSVFACKSRSSHLFGHKYDFPFTESLTAFRFVYTKSLVSKCETGPFRQSARTSLERLAHQRHPAATGAGNERLAVKVNAHQGATSTRGSRSLKIEATGDFFLKKITPRIRLCGKWLERAGFKPGHRVEIRLEEPGTMTVRFMEQPEIPTP